MSLNSLQDDMSRRAASMAAMAKRANNPQEIQAIQKSLVAGVQNGSIQPYVGIPLIQELTKKLMEAKSKMAQAMAGGDPMQPQQAPQAPVAQQVMQRAAQEEQGLAALQSNLPQEYAGGGIIAFDEGGTVGEAEAYQAELERRARAAAAPEVAPVSAAPAAMDPKSLQGFVKQYQDLMTAIPKGASQTEYENFLKNRSGDAEAAKKQDLYLAMAQFGANLAAGTSPRALENLGQAGIKTLPAVQEAYKQRRLADETSLRGRAELDRMSRAEQIEALKGGVGLYGKERELGAEADKADLQRKNALEVARMQMANKPTDLINFVNDYVAKALKNGDKRPVETIRVEGYDKAPMLLIKQEAIAANRSIAGGAQNLTGTGQDITAQTAALNAWGRLMDSRTPEKKEFQALQRQDKANADKGTPSKLAETYKDNWFKNNTPGAPRAPAAPPPPAAPAASRNALPPGARQIGTSGGKPVYQTPDGKQFIQN